MARTTFTATKPPVPSGKREGQSLHYGKDAAHFPLRMLSGGLRRCRLRLAAHQEYSGPAGYQHLTWIREFCFISRPSRQRGRDTNELRPSSGVSRLIVLAALLGLLLLAGMALAACGGGEEYSDPPARDLEDAIRRGTVHEIQTFIASGADINTAETSTGTRRPLISMAVSRHKPHWLSGVEHDLDALRTLVAAGADVNARDPDGNPVLSDAISEDPEAVRILVAAGADVNARDSYGDPMLSGAIWRNDVEAVRILIDAGADVNARDADGDPMLSGAIWRDHVEVVRILIDAGADVNARNAFGDSLLEYARGRDKTEIAQLLVDAGATE